MKIGILTFHRAINYGAVLQAYALQHVLREQGHEALVIDYCPSYMKRAYRLFFIERIKGQGLIGNLQMLLRECLAFPSRYKRHKAFARFIHTHIHLQKMCKETLVSQYSTLIIGSDQVWNAGITKGMDAMYWGTDSIFDDIKHISYAASAGNIKDIELLAPQAINDALARFVAVSVREQSLVDYITSKTGIIPKLVLDPVLLAGRNAFESLIPLRKSDKPYLLLFSLCRNDSAYAYAKEIAKDKGLEMIEMISNGEVLRDKAVITSASPYDFLSYFYNAKYVVSTSFHGTAFAILFHKDFCVYSDNIYTGERMFNLLEMLDLQERLVKDRSRLPSPKAIEWRHIDSILETKRKSSIQFIEEALKSNV